MGESIGSNKMDYFFIGFSIWDRSHWIRTGIPCTTAGFWRPELSYGPRLCQKQKCNEHIISTKYRFCKNSAFSICFWQTAKTKMTATTVGWFHVFGKNMTLPLFLPVKSQFLGFNPFSVFLYNKWISWGLCVWCPHILLYSYIMLG